jgi:hypothetical protein
MLSFLLKRPLVNGIAILFFVTGMLGLLLRAPYAQDCVQECDCVNTTCFDSFGGVSWLNQYNPAWCNVMFTSTAMAGQGDNSFEGHYRGDVLDGNHCGCPNIPPSTGTKETGASVDDTIPWATAPYNQYCNHCNY